MKDLGEEKGEFNSPPAARSCMGVSYDWAMNPRKENTTTPAKILVALFKTHSAKQSLQQTTNGTHECKKWRRDDVLTAARLCVRALTCSSRCCICCSSPERSALLDSGRRSKSPETLHHTISTARGERLTGYEREVKGTVRPEIIV